MRILFWLVYSCLCVGGGWILGSKYKAPPIVLDATDRLVIATGDMIRSALEKRKTMPAVDLEKIVPKIENAGADQADIAAAALAAMTAPGEIPAAPVTPNEEIRPLNGTAPFLRLCKMKKITNAPGIDSHGHVKTYAPLVDVEGVTMAMMPIEDACISSGFGRRNGRMHKGLDYWHRKGGTIFAAGDGQILEAEYHNDYGFYVLINHGNGYFTRYAHLAGFTDGVIQGAAIPRGFALGEMGKTSGFNIPKHLHFELLKGNYDTPKKSYGLTPINILDFSS